MAELKERRSISGIRGPAAALTLEKAANYARAFATLLRAHGQGNTIVVGRDTRPTSPDYARCAIGSLCAAGWDVIDLGLVPTPTVQIAIERLGAAGGAVITASHNPAEANGIKFLQARGGRGMFLALEQATELFAIYDGGRFDARRCGRCRQVAELAGEFDDPPYVSEYIDRHRLDPPVDNAVILDHHLHRVVKAMDRGLDRIRGMAFRVALDACGGAGIPMNYVFLDYLYCRSRRVNDRRGVFARPIEPAPHNLAGLCAELAQGGEPLDAAFATDCDNDRCVVVACDPESGTYVPLGEDYTLALAVSEVLATAPPGSTVVTNWATSQLLDDLALARHANLRRVPTGEVNTATAACRFGAAIAGEGSCAGVIDPRVGPGRDVLVAIWHTLAALARRREGLAAIVAAMPVYHKANRDHPSLSSAEETTALLLRLQRHFAGREGLLFLSREDGLIVQLEDRSRLQVRASNTEPLLRLRAEAVTAAAAEALVAEALRVIQ